MSGESNYADRVAARLAALRRQRAWTMEQLQAALAQTLGRPLPKSTLYAYERGKNGGGVDLPLPLIPMIAAVFGYKTAAGWLPEE